METNPFRAYRRRDAGGAPPPDPSDGAHAPHDVAGASSVGGGGRGDPAPDGPLAGIRAWVANRVVGKRWQVRAPLLLVFAWIVHGYLGDPMHTSIFDGVNLGFHEAGHAAFVWLGSRIVTVAGGTIFQLGVPIAAGAYLLRKQHDPFGAAVCLFWLGTALAGAGVYASDARAQALPLVSPFGPVDVDSHDWTFMLMKYGLLSRDQEIGAMLRGAGLLSMVVSIAGGAWVLRVMATTRREGATYADISEERRFAKFLRGRGGGQEGGTLGRGAASTPEQKPSGLPGDRPSDTPALHPPPPRFRSYLDADEG